MNSVPILFENEEIYVINKPSGLAVQGGKDVSHSLDKDFAQQVASPVYLVHRLDKDTSGLMIVAKSPVAAGKWTKLIGSKEVTKEYVAVCCGSLKNASGVINDVVVQHGVTKNAVTNYQVEKQWTEVAPTLENPGNTIDLCQIRLKLQTGRMHQIRIQLAKQNCPIIGDDQHGNFKLNKLLKKHFGIKKLNLASVKLTLPLDGKQKTFEIPVPENIFQK